MASAITVNGRDLITRGIYVSKATGFDETPERQVPTLTPLGQMGVLLGTPIAYAPRTLGLIGTIDPAARTVAALDAAMKAAKDLFYSGVLAVSFTNTAGDLRRIEGLATRFHASPRLEKQHFQAAQLADFSATILCPDPLYRDPDPTVLAVPANTRVALPLGTAPCRWTLRAMGASPTVTYRTAGGATVWTVGLTRTITASEDWFDFDARTSRIWWYDNGVKTAAIEAGYLTTGQQDWAKPFDPQDGDYATSQAPSIECSVNAEVLYHKRWL